jgi:ATP-dependent DNA ligase
MRQTRLYRISSAGKSLMWEITMTKEGEAYTIITSHGHVDGKIVTDKGITIDKGKAKRTILEQAMLQYDSIVNKKKDIGYTESDTGIKEDFHVSPMLAQNFEKHSSKIMFPALAQPKLDGVRCMVKTETDGSVSIFSRKGKNFMVLGHIVDVIKNMELGDIILDGELFSDVLDFQRVTGLVRKKKLTDDDKEDMKLLKLNVFDCIKHDNLEMPFAERWELVDRIVKNDQTGILKIVPIFTVSNKDDINKLLYEFLENGDEGVMIRNTNSIYEIDKRSYNLQKYKEFSDKEYKIVGAHEGTGNDEGTVIWICETENGTPFNVRPTGKREDRKTFYENRDLYIGKMLTVKYQELTNDGIPRFPVGITIRDYE